MVMGPCSADPHETCSLLSTEESGGVLRETPAREPMRSDYNVHAWSARLSLASSLSQVRRIKLTPMLGACTFVVFGIFVATRLAKVFSTHTGELSAAIQQRSVEQTNMLRKDGQCFNSNTENGAEFYWTTCGTTSTWHYDYATHQIRNAANMCMSAQFGRDLVVYAWVCASPDLVSQWGQDWAFDASAGGLLRHAGLCLAAAEHLELWGCSPLQNPLYWQVESAAMPAQVAYAPPPTTPPPQPASTPPPTTLSPSSQRVRTTESSLSQGIHHDRFSANQKQSLFCFAYTLMEGEEWELLKLLYQKQISVFACDAHAVFSDESLVLGCVPGFSNKTSRTIAIHSKDKEYRKGGTQIAPSWLNTATFMHVWEAVQQDGRYLQHDWTIKLDPDAVFFPEKLRASLQKSVTTVGQPTYIENLNCWPSIQFVGPLEVLTREGVQAYLSGKQRCKNELPWHGWGEDLYMQKCLDMLAVTRTPLFNILSDCTTNAEATGPDPCACQSCSSTSVVAFHPFKQSQDYLRCFEEAQHAVHV